MCPRRHPHTDTGSPASGPGNPFNSLLLHFRPREIPERTLRFSLTWGLGGMATFLVVLLAATGILLKFVFEPVPALAYESIVYLQDDVPFGQLIRNLHRWSGNGLVLLAFLHSLRVFFTGAIDPPRRGNWLIGMALFGTVVLSNFTGYLMPWDQTAYWAVTISTSMLEYIPLAGQTLADWALGGDEPGSVTLLNFYALHTAILPALLVLVLPFHFWRIRKANGLVVPRSPEEPPGSGAHTVTVIPHLLTREVAAALLLLAALLLFSMLVNAPLADPANPGLSPNPTKAPWYFMGLQELLLHFHPLFSVFIIPALLLGGLLLIPWLMLDDNTAGVWFASRTGRKVSLLSATLALLVTVLAVLLDESLRSGGPAGAPGILGRGLLPLAIIGIGCAGYFVTLRRIFGASRADILQALFAMAVTTFLTLTAIGVWFRGPGMQLIWAG